MSDPDRIWLQNAEDARAIGDRLWCADKVWPECEEQNEPTEYVRADLYAKLERELAAMKQTFDFVVRQAWREDPPHANHKLTDTERLSAIKFYPRIKAAAQPHSETRQEQSNG